MVIFPKPSWTRALASWRWWSGFIVQDNGISVPALPCPTPLHRTSVPALSPTSRPLCRATVEIRSEPGLEMDTCARKATAPGRPYDLGTISGTPICSSGTSGDNPYHNVLSTVCTHLVVYFLLIPLLCPHVEPYTAPGTCRVSINMLNTWIEFLALIWSVNSYNKKNWSLKSIFDNSAGKMLTSGISKTVLGNSKIYMKKDRKKSSTFIV